MTGRVRARRRVSTWLVLAAVVLASACSEPVDPAEALVAAFERTFDDSVAFRVTAQADPQALGALGEDGLAASAFLSTFAVVGSTGDGASQVRLQLFGQDVLDVRQLGGDRTFVRLQLAEVPGIPPALVDPESVLPSLAQLELGEAGEQAVATLLRGAWLGIDGALDLAGLAEATGSGDAPEAAGVAGGAAGLAGYLTITDHSEADGRRTYRVDVALRSLLADLGQDPSGVPATVPGSVFVEDDVVTRVRVDITDLTAGEGDDPTGEGTVELQVDLEDHGQVRAPQAPTPAITVAAGDVTTAIQRILRFATGLGLG